MTTPTSALTSAGASAPASFPGRGVTTAITIWLVAMPLFLIGVVLCTGQNVDSYLGSLSRDVVFHVLLKRDIRPAEATQLAEAWKKSGVWRDAQVVSATEGLSKIEELGKWVSDPKNRELLDQLPCSVDLRPRDILSPSVNPTKLSADLRSAEEVEQVFYDSDGVVWMRQIADTWRGIEMLLLPGFSLLAVLGAVGAGWIGSKLRAGREMLVHDVPTSETMSIMLACSGGLIALLGLGALAGLLQMGTTFYVTFLGLVPSAILVGAGILLGALSTGSRIWMRSRLARVLLPLLLTALWVGHADARSADRSATRKATSKERRVADRDSSRSKLRAPVMISSLSAALPPQKEGVDEGLSASTPEEREKLLQKYGDEISKREQALGYLDQWLQRSDEERRLDAQNRQAAQQKADAARLAVEYSEKAMVGHRDSAARLCEALAESRRPVLVAPIGGEDRGRRSLASWLLVNSANQSMFLLDVDRQELDRNRVAARQSLSEQARLDFFAQHAGVGASAAQDERRRLEVERVALLQKKALLQQSPIVQPVANVAAQASVQPQGGADQVALLDTNAKRPGSSIGAQLRQLDMGHYIPLGEGTLIHAVRDGKVLFAGKFTGLGQTVTIEHEDGLSSLYAFLGEVVVKRGQQVKAGDYLGSAGIVKPQGTSGIRFELRRFGHLTTLESVAGLTESNLIGRIQGAGK